MSYDTLLKASWICNWGPKEDTRRKGGEMGRNNTDVFPNFMRTVN